MITNWEETAILALKVLSGLKTELTKQELNALTCMDNASIDIAKERAIIIIVTAIFKHGHKII